MKFKISINPVQNSRINTVDFNNLPFGREFSDHMFICDYKQGEWTSPRIVPTQNISIHPSTTALHYGQAIFEGMKAYKLEGGTPALFRPTKNIDRFNISAERMAMPAFPADLFLEALEELINLDKKWIPDQEGNSLYIRPFMFASDEYVGIKPADNFKFIIFTSPVGAYYPLPVSVWVTEDYCRAFPGGVGFAKAAGNYGATLNPVIKAKELGFDQILWLDGIERKYVQEIGTMNVFFIINDTLLTPGLEQGTILNGVTRDSTIQLARDMGYAVEERDISIDEILEAHQNGFLQDAFGTGTAATISHISAIGLP